VSRSDAGRVIAGTARGLRLVAPGEGTRPFADRVKQTLFAILEQDLPGSAVLDLFAGSGAGGVEALSRGAARATFVERDRAAVAAIEENLHRARVAERAAVRRAEAIGWLAADEAVRPPAGGPFDVVLLDPPYAEPALIRRALDALGTGRVLSPGARVVVKHFWREALPTHAGLLASERDRRFGETTLTFYRAAAGAPAAGAPAAGAEKAGPADEGEEER
jgi:16S rRNA (guanine(966)-N(2))-methyltransferase RsmD